MFGLPKPAQINVPPGYKSDVPDAPKRPTKPADSNFDYPSDDDN